MKEQIELIEKADNAYQLQIKAQRTAEEAINHLRSYMAEQTTLIQIEKPELIHQETQTVGEIFHTKISQHLFFRMNLNRQKVLLHHRKRLILPLLVSPLIQR